MVEQKKLLAEDGEYGQEFEGGWGEPWMGIDLGTSNSCVAVYWNDRIEICLNDEGNRTTPSVVHFDPAGGPISVGQNARKKAFQGDKDVVYDAKRLLGRHHRDKGLNPLKSKWPFNVNGDESERPVIHLP